MDRTAQPAWSALLTDQPHGRPSGKALKATPTGWMRCCRRALVEPCMAAVALACAVAAHAQPTTPHRGQEQLFKTPPLELINGPCPVARPAAFERQSLKNSEAYRLLVAWGRLHFSPHCQGDGQILELWQRTHGLPLSDILDSALLETVFTERARTAASWRRDPSNPAGASPASTAVPASNTVQTSTAQRYSAQQCGDAAKRWESLRGSQGYLQVMLEDARRQCESIQARWERAGRPTLRSEQVDIQCRPFRERSTGYTRFLDDLRDAKGVVEACNMQRESQAERLRDSPAAASNSTFFGVMVSAELNLPICVNQALFTCVRLEKSYSKSLEYYVIDFSDSEKPSQELAAGAFVSVRVDSRHRVTTIKFTTNYSSAQVRAEFQRKLGKPSIEAFVGRNTSGASWTGNKYTWKTPSAVVVADCTSFQTEKECAVTVTAAEAAAAAEEALRIKPGRGL